MANPASWQEALVSDLPNSSADCKSSAHCTQQRQERNTPTHKGKGYIITAEDRSRYLGKHSHFPLSNEGGERGCGRGLCAQGSFLAVLDGGTRWFWGSKNMKLRNWPHIARGKERKPVPQTQGIGYPHFLGGLGLRDLPPKPTQLRFS